MGILKNGSAATTAISDEPNGVPSALNGGVIRRNSSTASLRQFVNSASPLIEEASDEEDDDADKDHSSNEDEELSENPVRCS